jgi:hypothetical protein
MRTTFAAREFTGEPLPDRTLYRILDNARLLLVEVTAKVSGLALP